MTREGCQDLKRAEAAAPGKIILFGEHAVVYGRPAIAVPLAAVQATASAEPAAPGTGLVIRAPDAGVTVLVTPNSAGGAYYNALVYPAQVLLRALNVSAPDMTLTLRSAIPVASGLGSGAAIATAIMRALGAALGRALAPAELNALVYKVEQRHHGTPSGIDNTVIVYEQPVYFVRGAPLETFHIGAPFTLLVADSGQPSPTKVAVGDVRVLYEQDRDGVDAVFDDIAALVVEARRAIEAGAINVLGALMTRNHALLRRLTVSSDVLDQLCRVAEQAGALGAKLSGGGRGGNMIALVTPERASEVAAALRAAGAVSVIETVVGAGA